MKVRGFTLVEVMVALFVIALGVGALLTTLVSAADNVAYLRDRSFAQWIAFNRVSELRLSSGRPTLGTQRDTVEYAGSNWSREQTISEAGIGDLLRVEVRVSKLRAEAATATERAAAMKEDADEPRSSLARAVGFIGPSLARASGLSPDWSPAPPAGGGPGGEGGPGGGGGGGGGPGGGGDGGGDRSGDPR